jgi:hypothetical protein
MSIDSKYSDMTLTCILCGNKGHVANGCHMMSKDKKDGTDEKDGKKDGKDGKDEKDHKRSIATRETTGVMSNVPVFENIPINVSTASTISTIENSLMGKLGNT